MGTTYKTPKSSIPPTPPPVITARPSESDTETDVNKQRTLDQKNMLKTRKKNFKPTMMNTLGMGGTVADANSSIFQSRKNKNY